MNSWKFLFTLIFSFASISLLTIVAAYTKCETKEDCEGGTFCVDGGLPLVGCYDGLCKCYKLDGSGQAPLANKCTEKKSGPCKTDCDKKTSDVVKNTNAYRCTGSDHCFCKFEKIPGAYQQCNTTDETANDCQPKGDTEHCTDNEAQCDGLIKACSCDQGKVLVVNGNCKDDTYCKGLCAVGEIDDGKLCKTKAKYKVCVCGTK